MIFAFLFIIPFIVFFVTTVREDLGMGFAKGFVAFLLMCLLILLAMCVVEGCSDIEYRKAETYEISALADNVTHSHQVSSTAFLIAINAQVAETDDLKYRYMFYEDGFGYTFDEVEAKYSYLNYGNANPRLEIFKPYITNSFSQWLIGDMALISSYKYVFYLPENAEIVNDFIIDWN